MAFFDFLFGKKGKMKQQTTMLPEQQQMLMQLLQGLQGGQSGIGGMDWLNSLFSDDPNAFSEFEAPAMRQFNEEIVPGIAERFAGMGAGSQNSSAFQNQLATAGQRLSEGLAGQRGMLRQQGLGALQGMLGMGLGSQPFQNYYKQSSPGMMQGFAPWMSSFF